MALTAHCPNCSEELHIEEFFEVGDIVYCDGCDEEFFIKKLSPLRLRRIVDENEETDEE